MERLHSYWRMPYIEAPKPRDDSGKKGGNPFVEMAKSDDFKKYHILWKGKYSFIVMNKFPYNCGHLLVLPLREVGDIELLEGEEKAEFFDANHKGKENPAAANKARRVQRGLQPRLESGAREYRSTCTATLFRAGTATRISCPAHRRHPRPPRSNGTRFGKG